MYLCKDSDGKIAGLAISKSKYIEFYPFPFGKKQFLNSTKLQNGFFILEFIPKVIFDAIMNLRDGTVDVPYIALKQRIRKMNLILGLGNLNCLEELIQ